jgi:hypothetical protein
MRLLERDPRSGTVWLRRCGGRPLLLGHARTDAALTITRRYAAAVVGGGDVVVVPLATSRRWTYRRPLGAVAPAIVAATPRRLVVGSPSAPARMLDLGR